MKLSARFNLILLLSVISIGGSNNSHKGVARSGNNVFATFEVAKSTRNDSMIWSYLLFHDGDDSTQYEVKYQIADGMSMVSWHENKLSSSGSLNCGDEVVYVFDVKEEDSDFIEALMYVSKNYGFVGLTDNERVQVLEMNESPKFEECITEYRDKHKL